MHMPMAWHWPGVALARRGTGPAWHWPGVLFVREALIGPTGQAALSGSTDPRARLRGRSKSVEGDRSTAHAACTVARGDTTYNMARGDTTHAVRKLKRMSRLKRIVETTLKNDAKSCVGFDHDVTSCRPN